jgi:DNA repair photolyase
VTVVDLEVELQELLAPTKPGDEIAPGIRFLRASTEVGLQLAFDLRGVDVHVEVAPRGEGRFAAQSARFAFSYRSEGGRAKIDPADGLALCQAVAARVVPNEDAVAERLLRPRRDTSPSTRVREVRVTRLLEPASHGRERFYKLSPYVGCLIGCRYCYAQSPVAVSRRLEMLPETPWGSYVDVRVNAAEVLEAELSSLPPLPIKFCPIVSDPYQAVEARHGITRACLEAIACATAPWPTLVLTRSKLVTRDTDVLGSLPRVWVGASIPTADDDVRRHFEPRAASVPERIEALTALRSAGVRTFAVVQPILPGPIDELAALLAGAVSSVAIDVLRGEELASVDFDDPRFSAARADDWQRARAAELKDALAARGVSVWSGELPPDLSP